MALPKLSAEQRQQALAEATAACHARSELLEQVTAGQLTVQDVLDRAATDETVKKTKVLQLVKALPGYGTTKAARLLDHASSTTPTSPTIAASAASEHANNKPSSTHSLTPHQGASAASARTSYPCTVVTVLPRGVERVPAPLRHSPP